MAMAVIQLLLLLLYIDGAAGQDALIADSIASAVAEVQTTMASRGAGGVPVGGFGGGMASPGGGMGAGPQGGGGARSLSGVPFGSALWHHGQFTTGSNPGRVATEDMNANIVLAAERNFENAGGAMGALRSPAALMGTFRTQIAPVCTSARPVPTCDESDAFRSADGSCNNLFNPLQGASFEAHIRFLPPDYGVDNAPRTRSITAMPLPSSRHVSNIVLDAGDCPIKSADHTIMFVTFGQFRDHDFTHTPIVLGPNNEVFDCCAASEQDNRDCFPIRVLPGDPRFNFKSCLSMTRSAAAVNNNCDADDRQQINQLTSYLDASAVYGSTIEEQIRLRGARVGGLLATSPGGLPPRGPDEDCLRNSSSEFCFEAGVWEKQNWSCSTEDSYHRFTCPYIPFVCNQVFTNTAMGDFLKNSTHEHGDTRVSEITSLTVLHIAFIRYHNIIANQLSILNPTWQDERIFQETRKIISAVLQHITYAEYLPRVLGPVFMQRFGLNPSIQGFRNVYNPSVDATTSNAFITAAFRFGHSQVTDNLVFLNRAFQNVREEPLRNEFNRPGLMLKPNGVEFMARWMITDLQSNEDRRLQGSVRNFLFLDDFGDSFDLGAFNIQRGRDHGLPSYTRWREWCGLSRVFHFGDGFGGLVDHTPRERLILRSVYRRVEDIDLYPGALSERSVQNAVVGPTFACLIANQFRNFMIGDRFWYENENPVTGFNIAQLNEIKRIRLSSIICLTLNQAAVQPWAMLKIRPGRNEVIDCRRHPQINLGYWNYYGE